MRQSAGCIAIVIIATGVVACSKKDNATEPAVAEAVAEATVQLPRSAAPEGAQVWFITPLDGSSVTSPVNVEFGSANVAIVPAGENTPASGHHHLIINNALPEASAPIPKDGNHRHFGDGSTSTMLELSPGRYRLTLLLGDYLHIPHDPPIASETIDITVAVSE